MQSSQWVGPRLNAQQPRNLAAQNSTPLLVHPMPEEYFIGHIGRWQRLLGRKNPKSVIAHLRGIASEWATNQTPNVSLIAAASGVAAQAYVRDHTLIPYEFFCATKNSLADEGGLNPSTLDKSCNPTSTFHAKLCPECVKNDIAKYGFSYWHCRHQIPGRFWCGAHEESQLRIVTEEKKPFENLPQHWLVTNESVLHDWSSLRENISYKRYIAISEKMLTREGPVCNESFQSALSITAMSYGIEVSKSSTVGKNKTGLAQLTVSHISSEYVESIFPSVDQENIQQRRLGVDSIFSRATDGSTGIAMAMALLMPKCSTTNQVFELNETFLHELKLDATSVPQQYLNCNGDLDTLAMQWQVGKILTHRRVRQSAPAIMSYFKDRPEFFAFNAFRQGASIATACKKFGVDPAKLEKIIWLNIAEKNIYQTE